MVMGHPSLKRRILVPLFDASRLSKRDASIVRNSTRLPQNVSTSQRLLIFRFLTPPGKRCSRGIIYISIRYNLSYEPAFALPWRHPGVGGHPARCRAPCAISLGKRKTALPRLLLRGLD